MAKFWTPKEDELLKVALNNAPKDGLVAYYNDMAVDYGFEERTEMAIKCRPHWLKKYRKS